MRQRSSPSARASLAVRTRCGLLRLAGNAVKLTGYAYHVLQPAKRFVMDCTQVTEPLPAAANMDKQKSEEIPAVIWQTNYSCRATWPLWVNHRVNRFFSQGFAYRFLDTAARETYIQTRASSRVQRAYASLTDGAAQADLWRLLVLYLEGGVYMDIDATLTAPLRKMLTGKRELFIANYGEFTNFFMASAPRNPILGECLNAVVRNIENYRAGGIFVTTGPAAVARVLRTHGFTRFVPHHEICIQGAFTNEFFQYLDIPGGKWTKKASFIREND